MSNKRIIQLAKEIKISPQTLLEFLEKNEQKGLTIYSKINERQISSLYDEFEKYILTNKSNYISNNNNALELNEYYEINLKKEYEKFELLKIEKTKIKKQIDSLISLKLDDIEIKNLIIKKNNQLESIEKKILFLQYKYKESDLTEIEQNNQEFNDESFLDDLSISDNEIQSFEAKIYDDVEDLKEWGSYTSDNPWVDVFGSGDEAETAYWNCD